MNGDREGNGGHKGTAKAKIKGQKYCGDGNELIIQVLYLENVTRFTFGKRFGFFLEYNFVDL